jgi:hypothetical protein
MNLHLHVLFQRGSPAVANEYKLILGLHHYVGKARERLTLFPKPSFETQRCRRDQSCWSWDMPPGCRPLKMQP